jgi:hypothetical protein
MEKSHETGLISQELQQEALQLLPEAFAEEGVSFLAAAGEEVEYFHAQPQNYFTRSSIGEERCLHCTLLD